MSHPAFGTSNTARNGRQPLNQSAFTKFRQLEKEIAIIGEKHHASHRSATDVTTSSGRLETKASTPPPATTRQSPARSPPPAPAAMAGTPTSVTAPEAVEQTPSPTVAESQEASGGGATAPTVTTSAPIQPSVVAATAVGDNSGRGGGVMRSATSAKEVIFVWVQQQVNHYQNVNVTNFSLSWNDGLAFCALIHNFYPEAFDFDKLDARNRRHNFTLAFEAAEEFGGIYPLLDVDDMVKMKKPDWKCVFTYVQSFYRRFRYGREPPSPTKILLLDRPINPVVES